MKGLVIAGSYEEFRQECLLAKIKYSDYEYLSTSSRIRGCADTTLYLLGRHWNHSDFIRNRSRIIDHCETHNIRISQSLLD